MAPLFAIASALSGAFSLAGHVQNLIGTSLLSRFCQNVRIPGRPAPYQREASSHNQEALRPSVTLMKPVHGDEPRLEDALESFFQQDYPSYQIIFGLHKEDDTALPVIRRLQQRYPHHDVTIIINDALHGPNRKVSNLINMYPSCRHDILIISDSDIHVSPDYITHIVESFQQERVQLVTTLYAGLPASPSLIRMLGAHSINTNFLPGVMMSRLIGRQDCLGATMALKRTHLQQIGGFEALVSHVADDAVLGQLIRRNGGDIALARTLCQTTITETSLKDLFTHELRWGRTVRSVEPLGYGLSILQLPLFWAVLCVLFAPSRRFSWGLLIGGMLYRGAITQRISRLTNCALPGIFPFLIFRDCLSACVMLGSARGSRVTWRGQTMHISRGKTRTKSL